MSNLLKSKFLLGVMVVAAMFVAVGVVAPSSAAAASCSITTTLRVGSKGAQVQCLQSALGLTADGSFGPKTKAAVVAFQKSAGLTADGVFGPKSRAAWMAGSTVGMTYPAGCTSAVGFSPTTGQACSGSVMTTTYPAGCTSATGFSPTTGANCSTGATTTTTTATSTGPLSVALSTDTPASGYIVGGQATADLAHFTFSGNSVLNSVTLQRTGISDQNTLANVYLYNGMTRLTDGYSFNNTGSLVMNNLNIAVTGSMVIDVKADVAVNNSASTLGITLTSFTAGTTVVSANVSSNQMYYGTGSLATVYVNPATQSVGESSGVICTTNCPTVNTGTTQFTVWSDAVQVNTRAIYLKGANFRVTGSAPANALANVNLYIDGVNAGKVATTGSITGSTYEMFDFSAAPITLTTGSHTFDLRADVVAGASYTVQVALEQAADLVLFDPQVGVNIAAVATSTVGSSFNAVSAGSITINQGSASVVIDPTFNTLTNVTGGATNIDIAKFQVTGYGEDVKVQTLSVLPVLGSAKLTGGVNCTADTTTTSCSLNNLSVYLNGSQVGSSVTWYQTNGAYPFNLGSQMIIPAGIVSTIEIRADLQNSGGFNYISGTVAATLKSVSTNAQGQSSHNSITLPASDVVGNSLTVQTGLLAVSKNSGYSSQSVGPNTAAVKVGSYLLQNQSTSEAVRVTSLLVGLTAANGVTTLGPTATANPTPGTPNPAGIPALTNFSSLYVAINGTNTTPIQPAGSNTFSINNLTIAPGATQEVDIYANTSALNDASEFATNLVVTSIGQNSNVSVIQNGTTTVQAVVGQVLTLASGTISNTNMTLLSANSTAQQFVPAGNGGATNATKATFQLNATGGSATISEMKFSVNSLDFSSTSTGTPWSAIATGSDVYTPSTAADAARFKVGDVVQVVGSTGTGLGTVTAVGGTTVTVNVTVAATGTGTGLRLVPGTVTSITVNGVSAPVVNGVAYLTGLSLAVPNGGGGLTQDVYVSYAPVGVSGTPTGATSRIALEYLKYNAGGSTVTMCSSDGLICTAAGVNQFTAVSAPVMKLVGSVPTLAIASPSSVLTNGNVEVADVTVTANAKGDVTLNALPVSLTTTNALLSAVGGTELYVQDSSGNPVTTTFTNFTGTPTSGTSITTATTSTITFGANGYRISAGTSQTFRIFLSFASVINTSGAHTASASMSLGTADLFSWTDTGGNASATTGTDVVGSPVTTVSNRYLFGTTTPGFFYSYPTTTATVSS